MQVHRDRPLAPLTSFRTGGAARLLWEVPTPGALDDLDREVRSTERFVVLGGGSNVVVSDAGVEDPVVWLRGGDITTDGTRLYADGGLDWDVLVEHSCRLGLHGLEKLSGIPGSVGAAPIQNIAAYGQSVGDSVEFVDVLVPGAGIERWPRERCGFAYRTSVFKERLTDVVVVGVGLRLGRRPSDQPLYRDLAIELGQEAQGDLAPGVVRAAVLEVRRTKRMTWVGVDPGEVPRNAGSFFVSPMVPYPEALAITSAVVGPARAEEFLSWYSGDATELVKVSSAHVLLACGFRNGDRWGPVELLREHVLALTNAGGATSEQLLGVAGIICDRAAAEYGVELHQEPRVLGHVEVSPATRAELERSYAKADADKPGWVSTH